MTIVPTGFYSLAKPERRASADQFRDGPVHAVAGIGNPERFFSSLRDLGLNVIPHPFPDHHHFLPGELEFSDDRPVIMTEKDAVNANHSPLPGAGCWQSMPGPTQRWVNSY